MHTVPLRELSLEKTAYENVFVALAWLICFLIMFDYFVYVYAELITVVGRTDI